MTNKEKQKEKLTDLIIESVDGCARHWAEIISDHLLDSGNVIVTPCKVGSKVYIVGDKAIIPVYVDSATVFSNIVFYNGIRENDMAEYFNENGFGDTVFLTREEAEQALKERFE